MEILWKDTLDVLFWAFYLKLCGNCAFPPNFHSKKLGEISVFYAKIEEIKCSDSCNNINDLYTKLCVHDVVKNINAKVFNLMSGTNETRHID